MKKVLALLVVGLMLYAGTASALSLQAGFNTAKYSDVSHIWDLPPAGGPGVPIVQPGGLGYPVAYPPANPLPPPQVGIFQDPAHAGWVQENRAAFNVTDIYLGSNSLPYWSQTATRQLSGMFYDFKLLAVTPLFDGGGNLTTLILDMGALGRNPIADADGDSVGGGKVTGGVVALYLDDPLVSQYSVLAGPGAWVEADAGASVPGMDSYPTVNQNSEPLWLAFSFVDLPAGAFVAAVPVTPGTVFRESIDLATGTGHGVGFGNIFGGSAEGSFIRGGFGLSPSGVPIDVSFESDYVFAPNLTYNPLFNDFASAGWLNSSQDPVHFFVPIPEPITMLGMLLGVGGLGGYIRKRRMA